MTIYYVGTNYSNIEFTAGGTPMQALAVGTYPSFGSITSPSVYDTNLSYGYTSLRLADNEQIIDLGTGLTDVWLHFRLYTTTAATSTDISSVAFFDASGNLLHGVVSTGSSNQYNLRESSNGTTFTSTYSGTTFTANASAGGIDVDVHLKIDGTTGVFEFFLAGSLLASFSGDTLANGANAVRYIRLRSATTIGFARLSQIIVADVSTIGWRVMDAIPETGSQDFSAWVGAYTEVDDWEWIVGKTDSIYSNSGGQVESYPVRNPHSSLSTMVPAAVVVSARAFVTPDAAVSGVDLGLSVGGTFYAGGSTETLAIEDGEVAIQRIFAANPVTSSGWTTTDINNLQVAVRSVT